MRASYRFVGGGATIRQTRICYADSMAAPDVLTEILRLPEERARLALELIRSLDGESDPGAAEAWDDEIERRGAEAEAGTADTMTLDEYRAHVRARRASRTAR
jgi:putative addiction module component (TIGR02574 family)